MQTAPDQDVAEGKNPNWIRRLYFWTVSWAERPGATRALTGLSLIESSFFPIPPDPLLMAICFAHPKKWWSSALWCTVGSVLGGVLAWLIGYGFWEVLGQPIVEFYQGEEVFAKVEGWYAEWGFFAVFMAALTPIPYKIFTIASGVFQFSLMGLIVASLIGRGIRFFMITFTIRLFGPVIRPHLERYLEVSAIVMFLLGVVGVLVLKVL